jgi:predicted O-methyltransferase YrrM
MKGNTFTRLFRLVGYLTTHPNMIPKYFGESIIKGLTPLELQLPWISFTAIEALEDLLTQNMRVAEFGGGGSTMFFAKRVSSVLCIESSPEWLALIQQKLDATGVKNVEFALLPYDVRDVDAYAVSPHLYRLNEENFDVILVDGYEEDVPLRPTCFWHAENYIKEGGIIIVDDSWRYLELRQKNKAKKWIEYRSIGPCRPGVTTTDIYYY